MGGFLDLWGSQTWRVVGLVNLWVRGFADLRSDGLRIGQFADLRTRGLAGSWVRGFLGSRMCGFLGLQTHGLFEADQFTERLGVAGPTFTAPGGAGLGFDDLLEKLPWKRLS